MDRDLDLLLFLWRWKVVTSSALAARFCPGVTAAAAYKCFHQLERLGLIHTIPFETKKKGNLWSLTTKGFKIVREILPELEQDGFRSECIAHDYWVTAILLGEWLTDPAKDECLFTEQELRRYSAHDYLAWVPKTTLHRPDGYWRVSLPEGVATIALEVERGVKTPVRYSLVNRFYQEQKRIYRVIWAVPTLKKAKSILERLEIGADPKKQIHSFLLFSDLQQVGWEATLHFGQEDGKSLKDIIEPSLEKTGKKFSRFLLHDIRKYPATLSTYLSFSKTAKSLLTRDNPLIPTSPQTSTPKDLSPAPEREKHGEPYNE